MVHIHLYGENAKTMEEWLDIPEIKNIKEMKSFPLNTIEECKALIEMWEITKDKDTKIINLVTMSPVFIKYLIVKKPEFLKNNVTFYSEGKKLDGDFDSICNKALDIVSKDYYNLYIDEQLIIAPYKPIMVIDGKESTKCLN